jgi:lipopolysaccharide/colanic/teichoic acid biosynthesis glycosyltransferase
MPNNFSFSASVVGLDNKILNQHRTRFFHQKSKKISLSVNASAFQRHVKRFLDILFSIIGLVLLSPVFLTIICLIYLDASGSPFFFQRRKGFLGLSYWMIKFRTMTPNAAANQIDLVAHNEYKQVLFKIKNDPRITRFGRILRKTSLDELPQLVNVLKGEMSLVGPRPISLEDFKRTKTPFPSDFYLWDQLRHQVKPGITGLWQVSGRSSLNFNDMVRLDLEYVRQQCLWNDFKILLKTIPVVLSGKGAY